MNMCSPTGNLEKKTIDDLPDEVLEYILSLVSPYKDSDSCKLVSKRWCRTINSKDQYVLIKSFKRSIDQERFLIFHINVLIILHLKQHNFFRC